MSGKNKCDSCQGRLDESKVFHLEECDFNNVLSKCLRGTCCLLLYCKWREQVSLKWQYVGTKLQCVTFQKITVAILLKFRSSNICHMDEPLICKRGQNSIITAWN